MPPLIESICNYIRSDQNNAIICTKTFHHAIEKEHMQAPKNFKQNKNNVKHTHIAIQPTRTMKINEHKNHKPERKSHYKDDQQRNNRTNHTPLFSISHSFIHLHTHTFTHTHTHTHAHTKIHTKSALNGNRAVYIVMITRSATLSKNTLDKMTNRFFFFMLISTDNPICIRYVYSFYFFYRILKCWITVFVRTHLNSMENDTETASTSKADDNSNKNTNNIHSSKLTGNTREEKNPSN